MWEGKKGRSEQRGKPVGNTWTQERAVCRTRDSEEKQSRDATMTVTVYITHPFWFIHSDLRGFSFVALNPPNISFIIGCSFVELDDLLSVLMERLCASRFGDLHCESISTHDHDSLVRCFRDWWFCSIPVLNNCAFTLVNFLDLRSQHDHWTDIATNFRDRINRIYTLDFKLSCKILPVREKHLDCSEYSGW